MAKVLQKLSVKRFNATSRDRLETPGEGIRIEELLQLSHHSLVQYRLPSTGEIVPLLQIVPSKTDTERLLLVSPELADVLSAVIQRNCDHAGKLPHVVGYDEHERTFLPPAPLLFQRRHGTETTAIGPDFIRSILATALDNTGIKDTSGAPLRYTPHDFRRIFITDAILSGLPPHIAQVIAGHRDINVTLGYKAIYPEESIQAHLAFLIRRRALRPGEEYRVPTDDEWSNSSATSKSARYPPEPAAARSEAPASTSTPA